MSNWVAPEFVEIKMDAEIGSYQADDASRPLRAEALADDLAGGVPAADEHRLHVQEPQK